MNRIFIPVTAALLRHQVIRFDLESTHGLECWERVKSLDEPHPPPYPTAIKKWNR